MSTPAEKMASFTPFVSTAIFKNPIPFTLGEKVFREYDAPKSKDSPFNDGKYGFWFCDLIP